MRIRKILITIILICCGLLFFVGCKEEQAAKSISLNGYSSSSPLEFGMGKFSYAKYSVTITYENDETEVFALTEDMISETDKLKFYQEGSAEITISYKGASTNVAIKVFRNEFSSNVKLNDLTTTYTGKPITVEVEGDIPGGTNILYPQGNTFQNAGVYDMTAVLECDGFATKVLAARIVIEKATYDMSNAQLYDDTFEYNKNAHKLVVKGKAVENDTENDKVLHETATLPQGVSVSYKITKIRDGKGVAIAENKQQELEGNQAIDAGTYKVCAQFRGDPSNYNVIPNSIAYLTITRSAYDMSNVVFANENVVYTGEKHSISIASDSQMPMDVEVSYQIKRLKDGHGHDVEEEYVAGNQATEAGVYSVRAIFNVTGKSADNYTTNPLEKVAYLTIACAKYDDEMKNVYLDPQYYEAEEDNTYDIYFNCELPIGVSPIFTLKNPNGETIVGQLTKEVDETTGKQVYKYTFTSELTGEYTCIITFVHTNTNYEEITTALQSWVFIGSTEATE